MKNLVSFIICFILVLFFRKDVFAFDVFYDDFTSKNDLLWLFNDNDGTVIQDGTILSLGGNGYYFPYVVTRNEIIPSNDDFNLKIKFKFSAPGHMGDGIGVGFTGAGSINYFQFGIWQGINDGTVFYYNDFNNANQGYCSDFSRTRDLVGRQYVDIHGFGTGWHVLEIEKTNAKYYVYIDRENYTNPIFVSNNNQCVPKSIWFGNKLAGGSYDWTSLSMDYVQLAPLGYVVPTFTPTPTPTPVARNKIIVIPGGGASWNERAIVLNENVGDNEWKLVPFVKNYDALTNALELNSLVKDRDYYVWNYDWRRPVSTIVGKLNSFVESKTASGEKVDVVGHSLGGLVARIWAQDYTSGGRVGKIISMGSPHSGYLGAYESWTGGKISEKVDVQSVALNILMQLQRKGFKNDVEVIRTYVPALKDLMPTFNFVKKNNKIIGATSLLSKNTYLSAKNTSVTSVFPQFKAMVGTGINTKEWINLGDRTVFDKVLGLWEDGKPISYSYNMGDSTVLLKSGKFDGDGYDTVNAEHAVLPDKLINNVLLELGLGVSSALTGTTENLSNSLVFYLGSPADMTVNCDDKVVVDDNDGFVLIKNDNYQKCRIGLRGTGDGTYHLVFGKTDDDKSWRYFEGDIADEIEKKILVDVGSNEVAVDIENEAYIYELVKRDINLLLNVYLSNIDLIVAKNVADVKDVNLLIDKIFAFRKGSKESEISSKIIGNIVYLLAIKNISISSVTANAYYKQALLDKAGVDNLARLFLRKNISPSLFGSKSYKRMEEYLDMAKLNITGGRWSMAAARSILASKLSKEIW